jgi:hypothetical protein
MQADVMNPSARLTNGDPRPFRTRLGHTVGSTISRADLATATLRAAANPATVGHAVGVGY